MNLSATVKRAVELGATVRIPPVEGAGAQFALLSDPEGNPFGIIREER